MHYDFKEINKKAQNAKISMFDWAAKCNGGYAYDSNVLNEMMLSPSEKFHDYPYQEYYEAILPPTHPMRLAHPNVVNECALELEYVLNRNDANDTMRYLCALMNGDTEKAEEIKTQIQIKMAKRRVGLVDENHPDPAVAAIRKAYNIGRAQGRNIFDPRDTQQPISVPVFDQIFVNNLANSGIFANTSVRVVEQNGVLFLSIPTWNGTQWIEQFQPI